MTVTEKHHDPSKSVAPDPADGALGLHSCLRIVTQLGGRMEIESELGRGTVVRVYLPRHTE